MRKDCYYCHCKTRDKLIEKFELSADKADSATFQIDNYLQHNWQLSNPIIATNIHRIIKQNANVDDLYAKEKATINKLLLKKYEIYKSIVSESNTPLQTAAKLAVIGNIIDYGAHSVPDQIELFINEYLQKDIAINHFAELEKAIDKANSVLYIGDNAGEIVFDMLFIETMKHKNVTFAVRNEPIINDVTVKEAYAIGMNFHCHIITNGNDAPSTILELCSNNFINAFQEADLIISKGQGNYEGLMENTKENLYFLLIAKCEPIAELIGVNKGDMLIMANNSNK